MAMEVERVGEAAASTAAAAAAAGLGFSHWKPVRRNFKPDSPFFASGNLEREILAKQYECLVESCGLKFKTYKGRQQHLVDKHHFPTSFQFYKKAQPSKKQRMKEQQHRKQFYQRKDNSSSEMQVEDETLNSLVSAVSKLSTSDSTPSSISFGHRRSRGLTFVPRAVSQDRSKTAD